MIKLTLVVYIHRWLYYLHKTDTFADIRCVDENLHGTCGHHLCPLFFLLGPPSSFDGESGGKSGIVKTIVD